MPVISTCSIPDRFPEHPRAGDIADELLAYFVCTFLQKRRFRGRWPESITVSQSEMLRHYHLLCREYRDAKAAENAELFAHIAHVVFANTSYQYAAHSGCYDLTRVTADDD